MTQAVWVLALGQAWVAAAAVSPSPVITHSVSDLGVRTWTDNTGRYQVRAKLVGLGPRHVRLLKSSGHHTTVPMYRLSRTDRHYVRRVWARLRHRADGAASAAAEKASPRPSRSRHRGSSSEPEIRFDRRWSATELPPGWFNAEVVHLRVSRQLIATLAQRPFQQDRVVREIILGYPVAGYARTQGSTDVQLLPGDEQARLVIPVRGTVTSRTAVYAAIAGIRVYNVGTTRFQKRIRVTVDNRGIDIAPQKLAAESERVITGVSTSLGWLLGCVVRQIAYQQALANKCQFDEAANKITNRRINESIEARVRKAIATVNRFINSAMETFQTAPEPFRLRPRFRTTAKNLYVALSRSVESSSAVPLPPPPVSADPPFVAQVHASLLREAITDREVIQWLKPVVERFVQQQSEALQRLREKIREGDYQITWSPDRSWVTVYWYPAEWPGRGEST